MKLASTSFRNGGVIPGRCAFATRAARAPVELSRNRNPQLHWSGVPQGTRSLVLLCIDVDAPNPKPANVNTPGETLGARLPRGEFVHWTVVDIAPDVREIAEGACSDGVTAKGKRTPAGPEGSRQGINDYTQWFGNDKDMGGAYLGYDGPCPPWNDSVPHHYYFHLLATDLERCPVDGQFTAADVRKAVEGHVLARAVLCGRYALNPALRLR
jgi:Raf kinase inhibitor-like YbhB/YbcL family protein